MVENFLFYTGNMLAVGPSQHLSRNSRALSSEANWTGREANHPPPSRPKVKYACIILYLYSPI